MNNRNPLIRLAILAACYVAAPSAAEVKACFTKADKVKLTDAEGKKHTYSAFIMGNGTDTDWADFMKSRKTVALDDGAILYVKAGPDSAVKVGEIAPCKERAAKYPAL